ncbi:hypothetical protein [Kibdelosporangium philippinense]|uniref:hypothetical protein n=1 Tax=Kibdelosporangium philippinense TaxID=211113 RepID=UPI0036182451
MKATLTALNATNLPLATAYRPHGVVARQRDRGHGDLRAVSPRKPAGHRAEHRFSNARSASLKLLALALDAANSALANSRGRDQRRTTQEVALPLGKCLVRGHSDHLGLILANRDRLRRTNATTFRDTPLAGHDDRLIVALPQPSTAWVSAQLERS